MEILEGLRGDFTVYHVNDHLYKLIKTFNMKKYFNCVNKSCRASYIVDIKTNIARLLRPHSHSPDKTTVEQYKFLTILRQRARNEYIAPRALFAECLLRLSPEALKRIGPFEKYKRIIYKARNSSLLFSAKEEKQPSIKVIKPEFTILDGLRSDTKVYLCDGFLYFFRKSFNHKKYHDCIEKTCFAKLTYDSNTRDAVITKSHNHAPDNISVEYHKFLTTMRSRAREERICPKVLFAECVKELSPEAVAKVGSFERHKKILYHARNNPLAPFSDFDTSEGADEVMDEHKVPETLAEMNIDIDKPLYYKHHAQELKYLRRIFLRFYEEGEHPQLIFISSSIKDSLAFISQESGGLNVHIDTTFNINPKQNFHICCVNILFKKMVFPLIFSIMMEKSVDAFSRLLKKFNELKGDIIIYSVLTDYQSELQEALKIVIPDAVLKGSWFHFAKATLTEAQKLIDAETEDYKIEKAIKMAMVLPLLPNNYYMQGVMFVKKYAPLPETFINYLTANWRSANVSTFGEDVGIHYSVELFSMDMQRVVGADHVDVWKFMEAFLKIFYTKSSVFLTVKEEVKKTVYRNTYIELISEIEEEQASFLKTQDVGGLLLNLCDCMKGLSEDTKPIRDKSVAACDEDMDLTPAIKEENEDLEYTEVSEDEEMEDFEEIILEVVSEEET